MTVPEARNKGRESAASEESTTSDRRESAKRGQNDDAE